MRTRRILAVLLVPTALAAAVPAETPPEEPVTIGLLETGGPWAEAVAGGALQAVAELNARGGVAGRPLHLAQLPPARPWRDFGSLTAQLVSSEEPMALIGPSDRAGAHLSAQIATRLRIPLIALSPEASLTRAWDPWIFRGVPDGEEHVRQQRADHLDLQLGRALGYDLVLLIAEAAASAGPEPQEIRRYLAQGRFFAGQSGTFRFDRQGNRRGELAGSRRQPDDNQAPL